MQLFRMPTGFPFVRSVACSPSLEPEDDCVKSKPAVDSYKDQLKVRFASRYTKPHRWRTLIWGAKTGDVEVKEILRTDGKQANSQEMK